MAVEQTLGLISEQRREYVRAHQLLIEFYAGKGAVNLAIPLLERVVESAHTMEPPLSPGIVTATEACLDVYNRVRTIGEDSVINVLQAIHNHGFRSDGVSNG